MKKVLRTLVVAAITFGAMNAGFAADGAGQAGAYLKMGVGARALGMGSAFTAVANDSTAAFWNPAGLAKLKRSEGSFMHANLTLDREYNFFNYAHVLNDKNTGESKGVVALSHIRFGVDGIPETRVDNLGNPITDANGFIKIYGYFEDTETNTFASYARAFGKRFYAGANLKYLKHELYTNKADTWGMDLGFMYDVDDKTTLGLSFRDLGENLKWNTASGAKDKVPMTTTFGVSHQYNDKLLLSADLNKVDDMSVKFFCGVEYWLQDFVALRLGSHDGDLTLGASFKRDAWRFDYSYADEELGDAHRISASKSF
jgi:long-subunit fatty acid transport protein